MVFWGKNLDLGSNLFNLRKLINNKNKPKETLLLNPTAALGSNSPTNTTKQILTRKSPTPKRGKRKKSKKVLTWFGPSDTPCSPRQRRTPIFLAESFSPRSIYPESEKKVKISSLGFWTFRHAQLTLKAPVRHDSMSHPTPKFFRETLLWVHTSSQNFRSIRLSQPLQKKL